MVDSVRYTDQLSDKADMIYSSGHVHYMFDSYTFPAAAGAAGVTINFAKMPAGKLLILSHLCRLTAMQGVATANLSIGYAAYVSGATGLTVVADPDYFIVAADIGGAAIDTTWNLVVGAAAPALATTELNTRDGLQLTATIDTANMDLNDVITLHVYYVLNH